MLSLKIYLDSLINEIPFIVDVKNGVQDLVQLLLILPATTEKMMITVIILLLLIHIYQGEPLGPFVLSMHIRNISLA